MVKRGEGQGRRHAPLLQLPRALEKLYQLETGRDGPKNKKSAARSSAVIQLLESMNHAHLSSRE